jgi:hypothetical protein
MHMGGGRIIKSHGDGVPSNIALSSYTSRDSFENLSQPKRRSSNAGYVE